MKIESFTIENYRSIKKLKIDNLNPINVFFGKNNVGKSNILRALHLAFYCLKNDRIFLPDAMFFNRNIYRPIEIMLDLSLEEDFSNAERVNNDLRDGTDSIASLVAAEEEMFKHRVKIVQQFVEEAMSFRPLGRLRLQMRLNYNEEAADISVLVKGLESDYEFDYGKYRTSYRTLDASIKKGIRDEREGIWEPLISRLSRLGIDSDELYPFQRGRRYLDPEDTEMMMSRLRRYINNIKEPRKREEALGLLEKSIEILTKPRGEVIGPFSTAFNVVRQYFDKISDNFVLIPNKEYFSRAPYVRKEEKREQIEIFSMDGFMQRLLALIESPNKRERELIQKFYGVYNKSYSELGKLETITKVRDEIFIIFGTSLTSLPVKEQGLGVQDLFLYLAHMVLFDSAIIAIEEPEGGLSTENQRLLHNIIEDVYSGSDKQIFLSSHSEEFETPTSYIIEMGADGTKEISRIKKEEEYEKKIEEVLIERKLREEKEHCEALLKEVTERQIVLDILNYINKLGDEEKIDVEKISSELGYKKAKVQQALKEITKKK